MIMLLSELSVVFIAIAKHFLAGSVAVNWKFARQRQVHQHLFIPYPAPREELRSRRLGCGPWPVVIIGSGVKGDRSAASRNPSGASGTWDPNPTRSRLDERNFSKASSRDRV